NVDNIARFQFLFARYTMAYLVVNRGADGFRIRRIYRRCIVEWSGDGVLYVDHIIMAQLVKLVSGDAWLNEGCNVVQHLRRQSTCYPHFLYFLRGFNRHGHIWLPVNGKNI